MSDLISMAQFNKEEVTKLLDLADSFKEVISRDIKKVPTLRGRTIVNFFVEPSTRTRTSFELAAKRLSADVINISAKSSSLQKGESLADTAKTIEALGADAVVIRHPNAGAADLFSKAMLPPVINGGDGSHEHPTQALLDLYTVREKRKELTGLKIGIIGDIAHSRVARSNIIAFKLMGAEVILIGPSIMMPQEIEGMGALVCFNFDSVISDLDVIYVLRVQTERQTASLMPSVKEYAKLFGLNERRLNAAKKDALLMHPGPMNVGVEISTSALDGRLGAIWDQVSNGVAVRMAVLCYALEGRDSSV